VEHANPHAFRHCDATTIATHAPDQVHLIAPNLGHTDKRTGDKYYDMSTSLEAGRGHEEVMDDLRDRLGVGDRCSRRK
jgi:integrase